MRCQLRLAAWGRRGRREREGRWVRVRNSFFMKLGHSAQSIHPHLKKDKYLLKMSTYNRFDFPDPTPDDELSASLKIHLCQIKAPVSL